MSVKFVSLSMLENMVVKRIRQRVPEIEDLALLPVKRLPKTTSALPSRIGRSISRIRPPDRTRGPHVLKNGEVAAHPPGMARPQQRAPFPMLWGCWKIRISGCFAASCCRDFPGANPLGAVLHEHDLRARGRPGSGPTRTATSRQAASVSLLVVGGADEDRQFTKGGGRRHRGATRCVKSPRAKVNFSAQS